MVIINKLPQKDSCNLHLPGKKKQNTGKILEFQEVYVRYYDKPVEI